MEPQDILRLKHHNATPATARIARALYFRAGGALPIERAAAIASKISTAVKFNTWGKLTVMDEHAVKEAGASSLLGAPSKEEAWELKSAVGAMALGGVAPAYQLPAPPQAINDTPFARACAAKLGRELTDEDVFGG